MAEPAVLHVEGLTTELGGAVRAVDQVDLAVRRGETLALLGESGCGKSITALSLMRLLPPGGRITAGRVILGGDDLLDLTEARMRGVRGGRMGMIFQEPQSSLNPVLTVGRQIAEAVQLHDRGAAGGVRARVVELLGLVGIPDPQRRADEYPHQLSGGMKQRVMIAIALAGRPQLLIADEPTTALDVTIQAQVLGLLKDLQRETGMAVLLITHDLGVVAEVADHLAVMYAGQVVESAPAAVFFSQPRHPYSRMLFASLPEAGKRGRRLAVIPGRVPALHRRFVGCRFVDRCPWAEAPLCAEQAAPWIDTGGGQRARCHFADRIRQQPAAETTAVAANPLQAGAAPLLEVTDLKVHFPIRKGFFKRVVGQVKAVDGVSLGIPQGRTLALVGESGCGKTTAGKAVLQLMRPTAGQVRFGGRDLIGLRGERLRKARKDFQIIFQDPYASMNPRMLVEDVVAEGLTAQGVVAGRVACRRRVEALLDQVGLPPEAADRYPHEFSGGQRQRICVARALGVEPRLIVCDEPTSALDVSVQAQILNLLNDLQRDLELTYLFITHDISVVSYLAHEVAVMYLGRIVEHGAVDRIIEAPMHPYTQALLSAAPAIREQDRKQRTQLTGDMPSPANPPAGCHFHPRCPEAMPVCQTAYPPLRALADGRLTCCFAVEAK